MLNRIIILLAFCLVSLISNGQEIKLDLGPDINLTCFDEVQLNARMINWTGSTQWNIGLHSIQFVDDTTVFAVGGVWNESLIVKSVDKGKTWERLYCSENTYLNKVHFLNKDTGFIAGGNINGFLLKTTDGGLNWNENLTYMSPLKSTDFINDSVGYAVGYGPIFQTLDGGETWNELASPMFSYYDIKFADNLYGVAVGRTDEAWDGSGRLSITEDGGYTWKEISLNFAFSLYSVAFANNKVYISTADGMIITSDDHFKTWSIQNTESSSDLFNITFLNKDFGVSIGSNSSILTTSNGGNTWTKEITDFSGNLYSASMLNDSVWFVAGSYPGNLDHGTVIKYKKIPADLSFKWTPTDFLSNSTILSPTIYSNRNIQYILNAYSSANLFCSDTINVEVSVPGVYAGQDTTIYSSESVRLHALTELGRWEVSSAESRAAFSDVKFVNKDTGFIASSQDPGMVMKTSDGGKTWIKKITYAKFGLNEMSFPSETCGYVAGNVGTIFKTIDGGETWDSLQTNTKEHLNSIYFINKDIGYAAGTNGTVIKTTNGGISWENENINIPLPVSKVYFIDENKGFATPGFQRECAFLETFDGGKSWTKIKIPNFDFIINDIQFITDKIGFMIGGIVPPFGFLKTTDGGLTWKANAFSTDAVNFSSMFFTDEFTGYVCDNAGDIIKTVDGGDTWYIWHRFRNSSLNSIFFRDENNAFAVGNGIICRYHAPSDIHYNWLPKSNIINSDSPSPLVSPLNTTIYYVEVNNDRGCRTGDDINITVLPYTSLNDLGLGNNKLTFDVFPNPTSNVIHIKFNTSTSGNYVLIIYNMNGEVCFKDESIRISDGEYSINHEFSPGQYIIELTNSNGVVTKKLVVE
jgi:photosystem II stability/assembly factor-like uncharacterized protein